MDFKKLQSSKFNLFTKLYTPTPGYFIKCSSMLRLTDPFLNRVHLSNCEFANSAEVRNSSNPIKLFIFSNIKIYINFNELVH